MDAVLSQYSQFCILSGLVVIAFSGFVAIAGVVWATWTETKGRK